jgi:hypothetical protein
VTRIMSLRPYIIAILAFGMLSGMFSTVLLPNVTGALLLLAPGLLITSPHLLVFLVYLVGATLTIMFGGVPAALYERVTGSQESGVVSMWIWLAGTAFVSLPAIATFLELGF